MRTPRTIFNRIQNTCLALLALFLGTFPASAQAKQMVEPLIDRPLRHASICQGGDGRWYLTGTIALGKEEAPDFQNNDGIEVWVSSDLKTWEPLGQVWSIQRDAPKSPKSAWQLERRINPDNPTGSLVRGITAPEIHYLRDTFFIAYSMNEQGTGLLRSTSGKAEGPYEDLGRITAQGGGSPSLFVEDDGSVYWLWGEGWIARMKDTLDGLADKPVNLIADIDMVEPSAGMLRGYWQGAAANGFFLFKADGRYHLVFGSWNYRVIDPSHDALIASSERLLGPYGRPMQFLNHSGQTTVFPAGEGRLAATVSGADSNANFRDRAGIVPLVRDDGRKNFMRQRLDHFTMQGPWAESQPVHPKHQADPELLYAPDGYYYYTASFEFPEARGRLLLYRTKSLEAPEWEEIEVGTAAQIVADNERWPEQPLSENPVRLEDPDKIVMWEGSPMWHKNRLYVICGVLSVRSPNGFKSGLGLWRSPEGDAGGPYEFVGRIAANDGASMFSDDDGNAYLLTGFNSLRRFKPDMTGLDEEFGNKLVRWSDGSQLNYDCGWHLRKIHGKYVYMNVFDQGSYATGYGTSDTVEGPYRFMGVAHPHGGNASLFRDSKGQWQLAVWGNTDYYIDNEFTGPRIMPMNVEMRGDELLIEPTWKTETRDPTKTGQQH